MQDKKTCLKCKKDKNLDQFFFQNKKRGIRKKTCKECQRLKFIHWHMISRCYKSSHKKYDRYGGRGIRVHQDFLNFKNFEAWSMQNGYRKDLTLDRKDNDGDYSPSNCRWADKRTQMLNRNAYGKVKFIGVTMKGNKFRAVACNKHLGIFPTAIQAAEAYNQYIINNQLPNKLNELDYELEKSKD